MAKEFAAKGSMIQLGPAMNVARFPRCGRNFEYISGIVIFFIIAVEYPGRKE